MLVEKLCARFFDTSLPRLAKDEQGYDQPISMPQVFSMIREGCDARLLNFEVFVALQQARGNIITMRELILALRDECEDPEYSALVCAFESLAKSPHFNPRPLKRVSRGTITIRSVSFSEFQASFAQVMMRGLTMDEQAQLEQEARDAGHEEWNEYVAAHLYKLVTEG